jgi:hypothetical protein
MRLSPSEMANYGKLPPITTAPNFAFQTATTPALLYQTATLANPVFYTTATAYTPPNGGRPWGVPLTNDLGCFYDLRFPRSAAIADYNRGIVVDGECAVALFAAVKQTNAAESRRGRHHLAERQRS